MASGVTNSSVCTYCQEETTGLRVQCCVCKDYFSCLQCLSSGAEIGQHKNDHSYKFVDDWTNVITFKGPGNWTAREEMNLLCYIAVLGFGNWEGVSKSIGTRSPEEVKEEYLSIYLDGSIGRATWPGRTQPQIPEALPPSENTTISHLPPLDIRPEEAKILGFLPKRDDFERENDIDIEAEQLVSSLSVSDTTVNDELEMRLKLAQVDMYVRRLQARQRRKHLLRDYQLIAKFFAPQRKDQPKQNLTKEQREFRDRMRVFGQFMTEYGYESLLTGLEHEQDLRLRLSELNRYREAGIVSMDECLHYDQHLAFERRSQVTADTPCHTPHQNIRQVKSGSSGLDLSYQEVLSAERRESGDDLNLTGLKCIWPANVVNNCYEQQGSPYQSSQSEGELEGRHQHQQPTDRSTVLPPSTGTLLLGSPTTLPGGHLLSKNEIESQFVSPEAATAGSTDAVTGTETDTAVIPSDDALPHITKYLASNGLLTIV